MDKILGLAADAVSLAIVIGLVVYIWKTRNTTSERDRTIEEQQRRDNDHMLHELITKIENRSERDFEKLFKAVSQNTENIRELTSDLKNFKYVCDIKRQACLSNDSARTGDKQWTSKSE